MIVAILAPQHRKEESDCLNGLYYSLSPMQSHQMSRSLLRKVCILFFFCVGCAALGLSIPTALQDATSLDNVRIGCRRVVLR